jgi:peptidoglycan/LPS O-acetylase OafA/YrhL
MASATMAAVMIYAIGRMNHLTDWLNWRWLQFFSGISYSLYLLHVPIGERFLRLGTRLGHGPVIAMGCVTGAFALSVAAAWVLNRLVERPGIELGKRLRKWDAPANVAI